MDHNSLIESCVRAFANHAGYGTSPISVSGEPGQSLLIGFCPRFPSSHQADFDAADGNWYEGGVFAAEDGGEMLLRPDGTVTLVGQEQAGLVIDIEQPSELMELVDFYCDARSAIAEPVCTTTVPVTSILASVGMPVWIGAESPRLLKLTDPEILARIPADLENAILLHLRGDVATMAAQGTPTWGRLRDKWETLLQSICPESVPAFGLAWRNNCITALTSERIECGPAPIGWCVLSPSPSETSTLFCREFFGYTREGHGIIESLLAASSLRELQDKWSAMSMDVPSTRQGQIRTGIESRARRLAWRRQISNLSSAPLAGH